MLVVNNLAGTVQAVELNLKALAGLVPIEMFGHSLFPRIGDLPYLLTLGPVRLLLVPAAPRLMRTTSFTRSS